MNQTEQTAREIAEALHPDYSKEWFDVIAPTNMYYNQYRLTYKEACRKREEIEQIILRHITSKPVPSPDLDGGSKFESSMDSVASAICDAYERLNGSTLNRSSMVDAVRYSAGDITRLLSPRTGCYASEYTAWCGMKNRCSNKNHKQYDQYGGRGIKVCETWQMSFEEFIKDMGSKPSKSHSIDRINNNGDYEPGNCRWATSAQQVHNRSTSRNIEYQGVTKNASVWAKEFNISVWSIYFRMDKGLTGGDAIFGKKNKK